MGVLKAPKAPPPVDVEGLIQKQADVNRVDQFNPFGSTVFGEDATGQATQTFEFSPELQGLFDQSVDIAGSSGFDNPFVDQLFGRGQELLNRQFGIQEDQIRQGLIDRGIPEGSEAFNNLFQDQFLDPRERAFENLAFGSIDQANQQRTIDMNLINSLLGRANPAPVPQIDVTGPTALATTQANNIFNQKNAARMNAFNSIGKLGAAFIGS